MLSWFILIYPVSSPGDVINCTRKTEFHVWKSVVYKVVPTTYEWVYNPYEGVVYNPYALVGYHHHKASLLEWQTNSAKKIWGTTLQETFHDISPSWIIMLGLPSGKRWHDELERKSPFSSWANQRFLWAIFNVANCNSHSQRVQVAPSFIIYKHVISWFMVDIP